MNKRILVVLVSVIMFGLCGCNGGGTGDEQEYYGGDDMSIYEESDGTVVYDFEPEKSKVEHSDGKLTERTEDSIEVSAPEGSIDMKKAEELIDSCSYEEFYLPSKVSGYQKYYSGTVEKNRKKYYAISLYLEKDSVRMYVGTNILVACDGSEILKQSWTGSYMSVELGGSKNDPSPEKLYKNVKVMPGDALFALNNVSPEKLGLDQKLSAYTFEIDNKLYTRKSLKCYQITPKLTYENTTKMASPIYVVADGTNRIMMKIEDKEDYKEIK